MTSKRQGLGEQELRRKFEELQPEPLFDMTERTEGEPTKRAAKPKTMRKATCPECHQEIGVIKTAQGLKRVEIFRPHDKLTIKGRRFYCRGSETEAPNE